LIEIVREVPKAHPVVTPSIPPTFQLLTDVVEIVLSDEPN
jgi:hypothetical protein